MKWALVVVVVEVRREGSNGKKPPEDKVEMENHSSENEEDDSSSETSLKLNIDPQWLASVGLDRPLLKLRLTPRRRIIATAPGGGNTATIGRRNCNCTIA